MGKRRDNRIKIKWIDRFKGRRDEECDDGGENQIISVEFDVI